MSSEGIDRLVDWRAFEHFVRDLYEHYPGVKVEHDVTDVGRSGARRQTDVKVTVSAGGHELTILIECKRWKQKVDRSRVDVLAASVKDLGASKGVIFTTSGFEAGAEQYAKAENIDLFIVRDLTDEEWGLPGPRVSFFLHYWNARIEHLAPGQAQLIPVVTEPPTRVEINPVYGKDAPEDPQLVLHSVRDGRGGPNLRALTLDARVRTLQLLAPSVSAPLDGGADGAGRAWLVPVRLDLRQSEHRQLHRPYGAVRLEHVDLLLLVTLHQSLFEHDRRQNFDFALAVENYLTRQRRVAARGTGAETMGVHELHDAPAVPAEEVVQIGSIIPVVLEYWVGLGRVPEPAKHVRPITFTLPKWDVVQQRDPADGKSDATSAES